jgi:hypothetical protein
MQFFTEEQAAALAETTARVASLVEFDFVSGPSFVWNGFGDLDTGGNIYKGLAGLGQIDGLEQTRGPQSRQVTFTLSGVSDGGFLPTALAETDEVQGRLVVVSLQLFDVDWQVVGAPFPIWFGIMQPPRVTRTPMEGVEGAAQTVTLPAENLFVGRSRPPAGRYTDRDHQTRYPGDRFFDRVADLVNKVIAWPV